MNNGALTGTGYRPCFVIRLNCGFESHGHLLEDRFMGTNGLENRRVERRRGFDSLIFRLN